VPANWYDADNPTYTGPELVTDFSTYASEAEFFADGFVRSDVTKVTFDATNDTLDITDGSNVRIDGHVPFVEGVTYEVSITNDGPVSFQDNFSSFSQFLPAGTSTFVFTKSSGDNVRVVVGAGNTASISNISVRQVSAPQFGWPEPEYIGPELVVDGSGNWIGDFDVAADVSEWTGRNANTQLSLDSNSLRVEAGAADVAYAYKRLTADANKVYRVTLDYENVQGVVRVYAGIGTGTNTYYDSGNLTGSGSLDFVFVPTSADPYISLYASVSNTLGDASLYDNISVREINPLSVSIQMDGRMTYADEGRGGSLNGGSGEAVFYLWKTDSSNYVENYLDTSGTRTGTPFAIQKAGGIRDYPATPSYYSPGILTPFNIASRHGSTFINGAVDGVALTADTTPTALPDLSNTDLQIAYDFMGTIGTFRQFAGDIGDAGLVTATNPSTEPTLSLTFNGTGGSYYNLSWSE